MWFVYWCLTDGETDSLWWPALSGCPVLDIGYIYLYEMIKCVEHCFCANPPTYHLSVHWLSFWKKNELHKLTGTSSTWDLHDIQRIIGRGVLGLATDSRCGVWGHGWTTCLLYHGALLGLGFHISVGMKVWYGGKRFFYRFLAFIYVLFMLYYPILPVIFPLKLTYKYFFIVSILYWYFLCYVFSILCNQTFHYLLFLTYCLK